MSRLFGLLNALAWALAVAIAWTERRDPTRPRPEAAADDAAQSDAMSGEPVDDAAPPTAPAKSAQEQSSPESGSASESAARLVDTTPPPAPPTAQAAPAAGDVEPSSAVPSSTDPNAPPPTAAAPISDEPTPGRPIVGTEAPIVVRSGAGPRVPEGAVGGDGTAICPPDHPVKGNASSMIYHQPGQPSYERTVAEFCFVSVEAAEAAGYRAPRR